MKKKLMTVFAVCLSLEVFAQEEQVAEIAESPSSNTIAISTRPEIMGLWGMEIPKNKQCVEYYNFSSNNEVIIKSNNEWSLGQYQYQVQSNRSEQLPTLIFHIKYDNNEKDCSGIQEDQTGEIQQFFVKWVDQARIQFCGNERGENCFATLNKQLP